jgi:hypothetical protein
MQSLNLPLKAKYIGRLNSDYFGTQKTVFSYDRIIKFCYAKQKTLKNGTQPELFHRNTTV